PCVSACRHSVRPPRALPSFPTRRSSDLIARGQQLFLKADDPPRHQQPRLDFIRIEGLGDVVISPGLETLHQIALTVPAGQQHGIDRKSTRLNSSHLVISYAVFCLKKTIYESKKSLVCLGRASFDSARTEPAEI